MASDSDPKPPDPDDAASESQEASPPREPRPAADAADQPAPETGEPIAESAGGEFRDEDLPDWEELTPELMEDECRRGDFMLRWAVILLSLLMGWTLITETSVLVSIRSGEFIASQGGLPPRTDPFSSTAADRPWVNLGWLSDLLLGAVHQSLGMRWLTVLSALTAALTFYVLSRISLPDVSTWWPSVCSAAALIALFPVLQPGASSVTALGLATLLGLMAHWQARPGGRLLWGLPILFLFWTNLDPRAWIGMVLLLLFTIGQQVRRRRPAPAKIAASESEDASLGILRRNWTIVAVTFAVGLHIHPWTGAPALAFLPMYRAALEAQAYGGHSEFFGAISYGLIDLRFWQQWDLFVVAAVALLAVSLITQVLNFKRLHWGWASVWLGANLLSLVFGEMVPYAAVINGVVAALNGQDWYRANFSMEYRIDTWSVLYARAGRAVTVLTFFALAYVSVNGFLMGAAGRRVGMGLDPRWRNRIESLETAVLSGVFTERIFPMLPIQGDLLLWLGKKPFIDSRLALYVDGGTNLAQLHREVRTSIFTPGSEREQADRWKEVLSQYETFDVFTRLWGAVPAYNSFFQLMTSGDWAMTGFGGAGANFTRADLPDESLQAHLVEHRATRYVQEAFTDWDRSRITTLPPTFPRPVSAYDRWLIQQIPEPSNAAQTARHLNEIRVRLSRFLTPHQAAALGYLSIRNSREALQESPNDPTPYRALSEAYSQLNFLEQQFAQAGGGSLTLPLRNGQALAAAYHALQAGGERSSDLFRLFQLLMAQEKLDTALHVLDRLQEATLEELRFAVQGQEDVSLVDFREQLSAHVDEVAAGVEEARAEGAHLSQLALYAINGRCPAQALALLEEDLTELAASPDMQMLFATLLLDNGRTQEGWEQLEALERMMPQRDVPQQMMGFVSQWRNMTALANLAAGEADRALNLWGEDARSQTRATLASLVQQPFASSLISVQHDLWPATQARLTATALFQYPERWAHLVLQQALVQLEVGRLAEATELLESILEHHPEYSQRGVVVIYLGMLTGREYELSPPSNWIPVWEGMFAPDEDQDEDQ